MAEPAASLAAMKLLTADTLSDKYRMMLICCCCGQTVSNPVLMRCLHGCCSPCAAQLRKAAPAEEAEKEMEAIGGAASAPVTFAGAATPSTERSPADRIGHRSASDPGDGRVKPAAAVALCLACAEPQLLDAGLAERRNSFLDAMLHSLLVEKQYERRESGPPSLPPPPSCDACKALDGGKMPATSRCAACRRNLCDSCTRSHNFFFKEEHAASLSPLSCCASAELSHSPAMATCTMHSGKRGNAVCMTCVRTACDGCANTCRSQEHYVLKAGDGALASEAETLRADVRSRRAHLCDKQSVLRKHQDKAHDRRVIRAQEALQVLAARRAALHSAVERAYDALTRCCDTATAVADTETLHRSVDHLLAYSKKLVSLADDIALIEQHEIVTARLKELQKEVDAATRKASEAANEEDRCSRELTGVAQPASEDDLFDTVMRLCLQGHMQLPAMPLNGPESPGDHGCISLGDNVDSSFVSSEESERRLVVFQRSSQSLQPLPRDSDKCAVSSRPRQLDGGKAASTRLDYPFSLPAARIVAGKNFSLGLKSSASSVADTGHRAAPSLLMSSNSSPRYARSGNEPGLKDVRSGNVWNWDQSR